VFVVPSKPLMFIYTSSAVETDIGKNTSIDHATLSCGCEKIYNVLITFDI